MTARTGLTIAAGVIVLVLLAFAVTRFMERIAEPRVETAPAPVAAPPAEAPHITATLFYATQEGDALVPVRREVPLEKGVVAQGRQILMAQLQPAPASYLSAIPAGTTLRAFYVTDRGDAFVDLSPEIVRGHPGGSLNELLTVYAVVNTVTANLPAARRVQILVDGKEEDTIAGHVDLRRPLTRNESLVRGGDEK